MMRMDPILLLAVVCAATIHAAPPRLRAGDTGSNDARSVDSLVDALYEVVSAPPGQERDWDRFRSLFAEDARLIPTGPREAGGFQAPVMDVDAYIASTSEYLRGVGFVAKEIARSSDRYGHFAHVLTTLAAYHSPDEQEPFLRGIQSIQCFHDGTRWWILSVLTEAEHPDRPLPEKYLTPPTLAPRWTR